MRQIFQLSILFLPACFFVAEGEVGSASQPGAPTVTVTSAKGPKGITFDVCESGAREMFFGVDVGSVAEKTVLRLLMDPIEGPRGRFYQHGKKPVILSRDNCTTFELTVQRNGVSINRIVGLEGRARLACTLGDEETLNADFNFGGCY